MSPHPVGGSGPMRLVLCAFPSDEVAARISRMVLDRRLAACAQRLDVRSLYWWKGRVAGANEVLVLFKSLPKRVGALFRLVADRHPYEVPEIVELDVPRVHAGYLRYLTEEIGSDRRRPPRDPSPRALRRRGSPRGRAARHPGRTRGRPRHR